MRTDLRIVAGCDLAAYEFKLEVLEALRKRGYKHITDVGCHSSDEGDYTEYAPQVGRRVVSGEFDRGLVFCGTGQGVAMAANKVRGVRAALCYDVLPALMSREHNNSNVLATGAWMVTVEHAVRIIDAWLFGIHAGGRHTARINRLAQIENER